MDIKEIALKVGLQVFEEHPYDKGHVVSPSDYTWIDDKLIEFAETLIESYKAELLKEVTSKDVLGEPVAYMTTDEEGSASMLFFDQAEALKYSGDDEPVKLFTESQLLAVLAKKDEEIEKLRNIAVTETNNARYWKDAHDEVCEGLFAEQEKNRELRQQLKATQEEWNQCSGLLDDAHRSIEMLEDQLAKAEQRVAEYNELIYAVQTKHHDETRHQTALRYIRNAENRPSNATANGASS